MKKLFLILLAIITLPVAGQKKQKVKGNREVLIKKFPVAPFTAIEVGEKFKIKLQKSFDTPQIIIETDDNLFDIIHFQVEDNVLKFWTSMEIVKKKRLRITVFVPENFNKIKLIEKGKVFNEEQLELNSLSLEAHDKSETNLNLRLKDNLELTASGKPDLEMEIFARKATVNLTDDASLTAKCNIKSANIKMDKSAVCELEGNIDQLVLKANDKTDFKAGNLTVKEANLSVSGKAVVNINVSKQITMKLSGKTETYLYGSPEIKLKSFEDNAVLYKK